MSWKCRKGWHSHAGSNSEPITFLSDEMKTLMLDQPITLVRFGKINNSVVANRMSPA
jgi:hypothetical protein